jgi:hypothetical protein
MICHKGGIMRIYTVTCNGRPAAVVRAANPQEAITIGRALAEAIGIDGVFAAREPQDAEMVSWLGRRTDHILAEASSLADAV